MYIHLLYIYSKPIINYKYLCTLIPAHNLFQLHPLKKKFQFFLIYRYKFKSITYCVLIIIKVQSYPFSNCIAFYFFTFIYYEKIRNLCFIVVIFSLLYKNYK